MTDVISVINEGMNPFERVTEADADENSFRSGS
jgi:hypothetical protein